VHEHQPAQVHRVQAVDVLVGVDPFENPLLVQAIRQPSRIVAVTRRS
jgi:hypothetical protein